MGWELLRVYFWSLLVVQGLLQRCHGIGQCWEEERRALLHLRPSFPFFLDWDQYDLNPDCCSWDEYRIMCNSSTGRIIELDMSMSTRNDISNDFSYYLNASLFLPFQHLTTLYLSKNLIAGCLKNEGFERLSSLRNLEILDLGYNRFDNSVLTSLKNLTSLRVLSLKGNKLKGSVHMHGFERLSSLRNLEYLDLGYNLLDNSALAFLKHLTSLRALQLNDNKLKGSVHMHGFERLSSLRNLEYLDLGYNQFDNSVLASLQHLTSLRALQLNDNKLKGSVHIHEINSMKSLMVLDLRNNSIESFEPSEGNAILNLPILEYLRLSSNYFNNSVLSFLRGLSSLRSLELGMNRLAGSINVKEFSGLHDLVELDLRENSIKGFMASNDGIFLKKLEKLRLDQVHAQACNLLQSTALFPSLTFLSLQYNTFNGCTIRIEIMNGLTNLEELDLSGSSLPSNILHAFGALPSLQSLSMRNCSIDGIHQQLIDGVCNLKNLRGLDMSWIEASGNLPSCFSNLTFLEGLDISHSQFRVPRSLAPFLNLSKLREFDASYTEIYDDHIEFNQSVPAFQLNILDLSGQLGLAGEFPKFLYHQHELDWVYLSDTNLSGQQFPTWLLENNPKLTMVAIANTCLSGSLTLPAHPHRSLVYLVISDNLLIGDIPPELGGFFPSLVHIDISNNQLMGNMPSSLADMKSLLYLDLSNNKLSGGIPPQIASMTKLEEIRMQNNSLEGPFPERLFNLPNLEVLDFSSNFISGTIPTTFNLPMITHIHLSSNKLHGGLPTTLCRSTKLVTLDLSNNLLVDVIPRCIEELNWLSYLILRNNSIKDTIPLPICNLTRLSVIDLSYNSFFGPILSCLKISSHDDQSVFEAPPVESDGLIFRTKSMSYPYNGKPLRFLIGIDLSCNKFTGKIPKEIGMLNMMETLNLSHNSFSGGIPLTISNLKQIETLDLSFNNLKGRIPPQIVELTLLSSFNVSFNNLSGPTPQRVFQFANFEENSYMGNPFLCGEPLPKSCKVTGPPLLPPPSITSEAEDDGFMDMSVFYISLISSYVTSLLAALLVLWINPDWRRRWFYNVEVIATCCYYYVVDHLPKCF